MSTDQTIYDVSTADEAWLELEAGRTFKSEKLEFSEGTNPFITIIRCFNN